MENYLNLVQIIQKINQARPNWTQLEKTDFGKALNTCFFNKYSSLSSKELQDLLPEINAKNLEFENIKIAAFQESLTQNENKLQLRSTYSLVASVFDDKSFVSEFMQEFLIQLYFCQAWLVILPKKYQVVAEKILQIFKDSLNDLSVEPQFMRYAKNYIDLVQFQAIELSGELNEIEEDSYLRHIAQHPAVKAISYFGPVHISEKLNILAQEHLKNFRSRHSVQNPLILMDLEEVMRLDNKHEFYQQLSQICLDWVLMGRQRFSRVFIQEKYEKQFKKEWLEYLQNSDFIQALKVYTESKINICPQIQGRIKFLYEQKLEPSNNHILLIDDMPNCSDYLQKDIYGSVVFLKSFKYAHELVKNLSNQSMNDLALIYSKDHAQAISLAERLDFAHIICNPKNIFESLANLKLSGDLNPTSGFGAFGHTASMDFFTKRKNIY